MITYTQARDAMVTHIHTAMQAQLPSLKVFWENTTTVDIATVGDRFLQAEVNFEDTVLASPTDLFDHVTGNIGLRLFLKEGVGTRAGLLIWDTLNAAVRQTELSGVRLGSPYPGRKEQRDGWLSIELMVPFEYWTA